MLKNSKNQGKKKLISLKHISHAFKTAKITVFDKAICNNLDVQVQDQLLV